MSDPEPSKTCCSGCTPKPAPADNVIPSCPADSSLETLECCGVPQPCTDTACLPKPVDECCARETTTTSPAIPTPVPSSSCDKLGCCGVSERCTDTSCLPNPIDHVRESVPDCCASPCCSADTKPTSSCCPKLDSFTSSNASILSTRAPSFRRKHTSLSARCLDAMCCCARSVQKRLTTTHHNHDHAEDVIIETKEAEGDDRSGNRRRVVLSVLGMDCPSCSPRVVRALTGMPSVADCTVDVFAGRATVTYCPDLVSPMDMARNVVASTGFKCDVLEDEILGREKEDARRMRVRLGRSFAEKVPEIDGLVVREAQDGVVEIEYTGNPRDVLAALAPWDPTYVPPTTATQTDSARREVIRLLKLTCVSIVLCIPVLILAWAPLPPNPTVYGAVSLGLTTIIQVYAARPIYVSGIRALVVQHTIDMDLLVSISTGTAYIFSTVAYACAVAGKPITSGGDVGYFETAALLVTLVMFGRLISAYARRRSTNALASLTAMQTNQAILVAGSETRVLPIGLIHFGDVLRVGPNEKIPTDGRVESGQDVYVDESAITGESAPVAKKTGAILVAGTATLGVGLDMRVTVPPETNTLARMADLLRAAQGARLRVQDTADRVAGWLAPVVLVLGVITFVGWIGVGVRSRGDEAGIAAVRALGYAVAVLVVSCPCAIALCVPMVAVIAVAVGTKKGVLFKTVEALENTCDIEVAVFDKTGTLTAGKLLVGSSSYFPTETNGRSWSRSAESIQPLVRALTATSSHPVSAAVLEYVTALSQPDICAEPKLTKVELIPGKGIQAIFDGCTVRGGSAAWAGGNPESQHTTFVVSVAFEHGQFEPVASYTLSDSLRPDSHAAVEMLARRGVEVHILSGDVPRVVARTAEALGISTNRARGSCTPEEKAQWVQFLQTGRQSSCEKAYTEPRSPRKVMFVGDGTNDALALVQADVGISLGTGTDVASSAAHVVLLSSLSSGLQDVFSLAHAARRRVWINFGWAAVYNIVAILFASGVLGKVRIPPEYAGLGELVSVLPVVAVAWSLGVVGW